MMLLADCEPDQLPNILARLEDFSVEVHGRELPVSLAMGWKAYVAGDQVSDLIEHADRMLYSNKDSAKKQVSPESASVAETAFRSR